MASKSKSMRNDKRLNKPASKHVGRQKVKDSTKLNKSTSQQVDKKWLDKRPHSLSSKTIGKQLLMGIETK